MRQEKNSSEFFEIDEFERSEMRRGEELIGVLRSMICHVEER